MSTETIEEPVKKPVIAVAETPTPPPENHDDYVEVHGARIDLLENAVKIHFANGMTRIISYNDFTQTMMGFLDKAQATKIETLRRLPTNVYAIAEGPSHLNLGFYFPEKVQNVNYRNDIRPRIVPNIIMSVFLTKVPGKKIDFKYRHAYYFCTNMPLARLPKTIVDKTAPGISILPFTNVYSEGNLCTGGNSIIHDFADNDLTATSWFHDMLWASPFNDDLGVRALKEDSVYRSSNKSWYDHLANLAKAGKGFPYEEVRNMKQS